MITKPLSQQESRYAAEQLLQRIGISKPNFEAIKFIQKVLLNCQTTNSKIHKQTKPRIHSALKYM